MNVRDILWRLRWKENSLREATLTLLHRGAPDDRKVLSGSRITHLGRSFFEVEEGTSIPYHRILRVEIEGDPPRILFERPPKEGGGEARRKGRGPRSKGGRGREPR